MSEAGWKVIGKSVRGAAHRRADKPNQDALAWYPAAGSGHSLILAVSDGHGSAKSFRSQEGAKLAVETAIRVLQQFLEVQQNLFHPTAIKRAAEEKLPHVLVRAWKEAVEQHLNSYPFTEDTLGGLPDKEQEAIDANPLLAYGATLLAVLAAPAFLLYLQLGDGDILSVADSGEVSRPIVRDERLFANETTSLCLEKAWSDFQVAFQAFGDQPPALILVSTDGYANSFRSEADFLKVGSDILKLAQSGSLDIVRDSLEAWLSESSEAGSGDDITLGIVSRI